MPIEVQRDGEELEEVEPGQQAYEALASLTEDFDEVTLMGLLAALQRGDPWEKVPPRLRALCEVLESELFEDAGGDGA